MFTLEMIKHILKLTYLYFRFFDKKGVHLSRSLYNDVHHIKMAFI